MKHKYFSLIAKSFSLAFAGTLLLVSTALASTYGSGAYGDCKYSTGCPPAASSSTSSNGSSSSAATTAQTTQGTTILLNDFPEYFTSGKTLDLKAGDVICFNVDNNGTVEKHCITIKEVGDTYAIVTIDSSPTEVRFNIGDIKQFDVTGDKSNDIEITLNSITNKQANFTFKNLGKAIKTPPAATAEAGSKPKGTNWLLISSIVALFAGVLWSLWLWGRRRLNNRNNIPPPGTPPTTTTSNTGPPSPPASPTVGQF